MLNFLRIPQAWLQLGIFIRQLDLSLSRRKPNFMPPVLCIWPGVHILEWLTSYFITGRLWCWQVWHWNCLWSLWNCSWGCKVLLPLYCPLCSSSMNSYQHWHLWLQIRTFSERIFTSNHKLIYNFLYQGIVHKSSPCSWKRLVFLPLLWQL